MKKILIAGSSSGIGRAISEKLLACNYQVIGLARNHAKFAPDNASYFTYSMDFSQIKCLDQHFKMIRKDHGEIEGIVCSAGYGEFLELEQFSNDKMLRLMNVNFLSQAILIKHFLPYLKKQKKGKIVLIGSECALEGQKKGTLYCAAKFALR